MSRFSPASADEVRQMRAETGYGMATCKDLVEQRNVLSTVEQVRKGAATDRDVADVLEWLVKRARIR